MKYSNAEKLSIITRYQQGENVATLSDELDIPRSTLYRWLKSFPTDSTGCLLYTSPSPRDTERSRMPSSA